MRVERKMRQSGSVSGSMRRAEWLEAKKDSMRTTMDTIKKKIGARLDRMVPPGFDWAAELKWLRIGLILCIALSVFLFFARYWNGVAQLYETDWASGEKVLRANARLDSFSQVMSGTMVGFSFLTLVILLLTVYHYLYYYRDSKSIYVMKRLPKRFELHRRSISLPLASIAVCLCTVLLLIIIYYGLYHLMAPRGCEIWPGQWDSFWQMGFRHIWEGDGI